MGAMAQYEIQLLGPVQVFVAGQERLLERQKAQALLAYLALTNQRQSRAALAALFWPDLPAERATANLRQALYALNTALGPQLIASDRTSVLLVTDQLVLDTAQFQALRASTDPTALQAAVSLYRGDLLEGLELSDSAAFAEWLFFAREAFRRDLAITLDALADLLAARDPLAAAAAARRRLALDPLHEPTHRRLMQLYTAANDRAAALRQYAECSRILRDELAAEPEEATTALFDTIRRNAGPAPEPNPLPLRSPSATVRTNLPAALTPFIGREAELAHLGALLRDPTRRLITLLGPGGIGKTRLAIEAARLHSDQFPDGVAFVNLTAIDEGDPMLLAIANALGLNLARTDALADQIADYLRPRRFLLVADNLEQLVHEADRLAHLLAAAPQVTIVATSRERLDLIGETTFDLDGMPVPPPDVAAATERYAALELFLSAVERVAPGRIGDPAERLAAAQICRLVAGAPLALELAAAAARHVSITTIASEIHRDLDFITSQARNLPDRHRGPRAVFEHSWRLLSADEQRALVRLSILWSDFDATAADAVLRYAWPGPLAPGATLRLVSHLVDKSLVRQLANGRYNLHELVRQYAFERIAADPLVLEQTRAGHAAYFMRLLQHAEAGIKGSAERQALDTIARDLDNIRVAWRYAVGVPDHAALALGSESLFLFYETQNLFEEGEEMFCRAATAVQTPSDDDETILLGNLLTRQGWFALRMYRFDLAQACLQCGLNLLLPYIDRPHVMLGAVLANFQIATGGRVLNPHQIRAQLRALRRHGDPWTLAFALHLLGVISASTQRAEVFFHESLRIGEQIQNQRLIAGALDALAGAHRDRGELTLARAYWERGLLAHRQLGNRWGAAFTLDNLGYVVRMQGDYVLARALHAESLALSRDVGDRLGIAGSLDNLGLVALDEGELDQAEALFREGLALRETIDDPGSTSVSMENLGNLLLARHQPAAAVPYFRACYEQRVSVGDGWLLPRACANLAAAHLARGEIAAARPYLQEALLRIHRATAHFELGQIMLVLAQYYLALGDLPRAAMIAAAVRQEVAQLVRVAAHADALLAQSGPPPTPPLTLREQVRDQAQRML